jgi:hypothetical protein
MLLIDTLILTLKAVPSARSYTGNREAQRPKVGMSGCTSYFVPASKDPLQQSFNLLSAAASKTRLGLALSYPDWKVWIEPQGFIARDAGT